MNLAEFQKQLAENPLPVIVDLWAPWCTPCRAMEPAFKQVSQKFQNEVDVIKVNADQSPEVLKALRVMGIPTVVGFANGKEIFRRTGMQTAAALELLFDAALHQRTPIRIPLAPLDRLIRSGAGLALVALGWFDIQSLLLIGIGGVLLFSAFYDRCPVYQAIAPRLAALFQRSK